MWLLYQQENTNSLVCLMLLSVASLFFASLKSVEIPYTGESGHGALAGFLKENGVGTLICGGIGGGARTALAEAGIQLYGGVTGSADDAVSALLKGELGYDPDVQCNHHDHEHGHSCGGHGGHEGGHSCGGHSCGGH